MPESRTKRLSMPLVETGTVTRCWSLVETHLGHGDDSKEVGLGS